MKIVQSIEEARGFTQSNTENEFEEKTFFTLAMDKALLIIYLINEIKAKLGESFIPDTRRTAYVFNLFAPKIELVLEELEYADSDTRYKRIEELADQIVSLYLDLKGKIR